MRLRTSLLGLLLACGGGTTTTRTGTEPVTPRGGFATDDDLAPTYPKADLERALIAERGAEATAERRVSELETKVDTDPVADDALAIAVADLAVRRRFIAALEACQAAGHTCPPRLDDPPWTFDIDAPAAKPPLDTPLRFDLEDWQKIAAELHGRACACRTVACVDSVGVAIDQLETKPMAEIQGDETASVSITRARECLFRLRGKAIAKPIIVEPS